MDRATKVNLPLALMYPEFIDESHFVKPDPPVSVLFMLKPELVEATADSEHMRRIEVQEEDYLLELQKSIAGVGVLEPLEIRYDKVGCAKLREGHHRLIVAKRLRLPSIPVRLVQSRSPLKGWRWQAVPETLGTETISYFKLMSYL